jgi:hypothetical protein
MKQFFYVFVSILFSEYCQAQSLSGLWKGSTEHSIWVLNSTENILEIEVNNDSIITGVIHDYYTKGRFEHIKISGTVNWKDSTLNISEEEEISHNINTKFWELCLGTMQLKLTKSGNLYYLNGKWRDKSRKLLHCPTLAVSFKKPYRDSIELTAVESPGARKTDIQKVIELSSDEIDSVSCALYDNGEIDNDTATVYFNDSLIIKKQRLSAQPVEFYISFDKTKQIQKIKLFADNLGSIPPNTALLIITTRKNRYLITVSSDYSKNGSVEFFLKE